MTFKSICNTPFPVPVVKGAQICQGVDDVRYYLNGVCFHEDGYVYGTNGHILFRAKYKRPTKAKGNHTLQFESAIPAAAKEIIIKYVDDSKGYIECYWDLNQADLRKHIFFKVIDGKYPDVSKVFAGIKTPKPTSEIGLNTEYVGLTKKVFGIGSRYGSAKCEFYGHDKPVRLTSTEPPWDELDPEMLIMPMRIK